MHFLAWVENPRTVAGVCLWAIAFSWVFAPQNDRLFAALAQRLPAVVASLVSMAPWLGLGVLGESLCD